MGCRDREELHRGIASTSGQILIQFNGVISGGPGQRNLVTPLPGAVAIDSGGAADGVYGRRWTTTRTPRRSRRARRSTSAT